MSAAWRLAAAPGSRRDFAIHPVTETSMNINPSTSAFVAVHPQSDVCGEDGTLAGTLAAHAE